MARRLRGATTSNGFDITAGFQAEAGAAVIKQVEFDIAAAADQLMAALLFAPRQSHARPNDCRVDADKRLSDRLHKTEVALPIAAVEIINKEAAGAARLVAVFEKKIPVAPRLEALVAIRLVLLASRAQGGVKRGFRVAVGIDRGQIGAAAKPGLGGEDVAGDHMDQIGRAHV